MASGNELREGKEGQVAWGTNAAVLKAPWNGTPSVDDLLADSEHTLVLDRFYRVGGENRPATPTECRIAYNSDTLFVVFRCGESDMSFPYANLDTEFVVARRIGIRCMVCPPQVTTGLPIPMKWIF